MHPKKISQVLKETFSEKSENLPNKIIEYPKAL